MLPRTPWFSSRRIRMRWFPSFVAVVLAVSASAQQVGDANPVALAIGEWVKDYERAHIGPKGVLRSGAGLQPAYVQWAQRAHALDARDEDRLTHLEALNKVLYVAESQPAREVARSLLGLAATGLEKSFLDLPSLELRELGHSALLRRTDDETWTVLLRAAAGDREALFGSAPPPEAAPGDASEAPVGTALRVAAIRLLAARALPAYQSTIDAALNDPDPPVRLAAAEAIEMQRRPDILPRVTAALTRERHPVVSQALVRLLGVTLRNAGERVDSTTRDAAVAAALRQFGRIGWRTDMDLLDLVQAWPHADAVPVLIDALDLTLKSPDALVTAVNTRASPLLRQRAAGLLRSMTGAILSADDPAAWRAFWAKEKEHIVVPAVLPEPRADGTRATFFGLPVSGGSIAFVIDTSGSMDESPTEPDTNSTRRGRADSRLRAAKEQLLAAVQVMPEESRYVVVTFADTAHLWTATPVKPGPATTKQMTELMSRLRANGATNLFEGLSTALSMGEQRFGEPIAGNVDELFLLTDGEPTAGDVRDADKLLAIVREANKYAKVRINTVFTGRGRGGELLRRLAEENGGVFVHR